MARTPDGPVAREMPITVRLTPIERESLDEQRRARGGMTRSAYLRLLVRQDGNKIRRERGD